MYLVVSICPFVCVCVSVCYRKILSKGWSLPVREFCLFVSNKRHMMNQVALLDLA